MHHSMDDKITCGDIKAHNQHNEIVFIDAHFYILLRILILEQLMISAVDLRLYPLCDAYASLI